MVSKCCDYSYSYTNYVSFKVHHLTLSVYKQHVNMYRDMVRWSIIIAAKWLVPNYFLIGCSLYGLSLHLFVSCMYCAIQDLPYLFFRWYHLISDDINRYGRKNTAEYNMLLFGYMLLAFTKYTPYDVHMYHKYSRAIFQLMV